MPAPFHPPRALKRTQEFLKSVEWRAAAPYLAVIAIGIGLSLLAPHHGQAVQQVANGTPDQGVSDRGFWVQLFGTAATCAIAVFAFLQIRDFRRSSERQLRAYVTVTHSKISSVGIGVAPVVTLTIANTGETPAYDMYAFADMSIGKFPLPEKLKETPVPFRIEKGKIHFTKFSVGILGKAQEIYLSVPWDAALPKTVADEIADGSRAIYVFGHVAYEDTFGKCWLLEFRYFCGGDMGARDLHMESAQERQRNKADHVNSLRIAGKSFDLPMVGAIAPPS